MDTELSNRLRKIETRLRFLEMGEIGIEMTGSTFVKADPDIDDPDDGGECSVCGHPLQHVRPGHYQCDFCEALEQKLKPWREWCHRVLSAWETPPANSDPVADLVAWTLDVQKAIKSHPEDTL
jgi:hypothetical protein